MQSYLSDLLGRERIADFRRDADRQRLAAVARKARRRRRGDGPQHAIAAYQPGRSVA